MCHFAVCRWICSCSAAGSSNILCLPHSSSNVDLPVMFLLERHFLALLAGLWLETQAKQQELPMTARCAPPQWHAAVLPNVFHTESYPHKFTRLPHMLQRLCHMRGSRGWW